MYSASPERFSALPHATFEFSAENSEGYQYDGIVILVYKDFLEK